jgi:acetyl esterase/lipase
LPGQAILFLHGGGYVQGSAKAYRGFVSQIVSRTGIPALVIAARSGDRRARRRRIR